MVDPDDLLRFLRILLLLPKDICIKNMQMIEKLCFKLYIPIIGKHFFYRDLNAELFPKLVQHYVRIDAPDLAKDMIRRRVLEHPYFNSIKMRTSLAFIYCAEVVSYISSKETDVQLPPLIDVAMNPFLFYYFLEILSSEAYAEDEVAKELKGNVEENISVALTNNPEAPDILALHISVLLAAGKRTEVDIFFFLHDHSPFYQVLYAFCRLWSC